MNFPGGWELVLVVVVIMVLFGAKRLPEASRSIGRSLRILKSETKGLHDTDDSTAGGNTVRCMDTGGSGSLKTNSADDLAHLH